ncbi:small RNA 2'-O-methyltransferase [Pelobates fuscus]|uniref:small RNA 2'-O-methyltransferase n=1 Tax=Pelobates fuscus TaxID=191477 RepID=UPI002FE47E90
MEPIVFNPRLYQQRYNFVVSFVDRYKPKKVADLGCNNCSLLRRLKFCDCIEELVGLDIDYRLLTNKKESLKPLLISYLEPKKTRLTVSLYHGSVTEKDPALIGFDLITCIELIEHLETRDLDKFQDTLFGFMAPHTVLVSTPNSEFNVLLPNLTGFRHLDHKFEWTREEFQNWASNLAECYNYSVEFAGVGEAPANAKDVGFCSQIGIFTRNYTESEESLKEKREYKHVYKTVLNVVYPSLQDEKYLQQAVLKKAISYAYNMKRELLRRLFPREEEEQEETVFIEGQNTSWLVSSNFSHHEPEKPAEEGTYIAPFLQGSTVHIPMEILFRNPKVKELCGNFQVLKRMISEDDSVTSDENSVLFDVDLENDFDITGLQ